MPLSLSRVSKLHQPRRPGKQKAGLVVSALGMRLVPRRCRITHQQVDGLR